MLSKSSKACLGVLQLKMALAKLQRDEEDDDEQKTDLEMVGGYLVKKGMGFRIKSFNIAQMATRFYHKNIKNFAFSGLPCNEQNTLSFPMDIRVREYVGRSKF